MIKVISILCILTMSCSCQPLIKGIKSEHKTSMPPILRYLQSTSDNSTPEDTEKPIISNGYRMLKLEGSVDADTVEPLIKALSEKENIHGFILEINNTGGNVDEGFRLSKAIEEAGLPVYCIVDYQAQSMAFYILQSCTLRTMTKRSILMIHNPSIDGFEPRPNSTGYLEAYERMLSLQDAMISHYIVKMKITKKQMQDRLALRDWNMSWEEALSIGAVDSALNSPKQIWSLIESKKQACIGRPDNRPN